MTAQDLARDLYEQDKAHVDETAAVERDGATAIAGWLRAAGAAGDLDLVRAIKIAGTDAVAIEWDKLVEAADALDELAQDSQELGLYE